MNIDDLICVGNRIQRDPRSNEIDTSTLGYHISQLLFRCYGLFFSVFYHRKVHAEYRFIADVFRFSVHMRRRRALTRTNTVLNVRTSVMRSKPHLLETRT